MRTTTLLSGWRSLRQLLSIMLLAWLPLLVSGQSANVVISQVYTAGGNSGAFYNQDFIELFNRSTSSVTITGWTIQYASATGVFGNSNNSYTLTAATIPAGGHYLVGIGTAAVGNGVAFTADQPTGNTIAINSGFAAAAGKIALATNATTVTYTASGGFSANVVDAVGYGSTATAYEGSAAAPAPASASAAIFRTGNGCTDTNNNGADFVSGAVSNPVRNSGTASSLCGNIVLVANPSALSLAAPTGQVATVATYTLAGYNLAPNATINISSNNAAVLVSTTGAAGSFASAVSVTATTAGTLTQTVSVQFTAPAVAGTTTATISNTDGTRTATVAVTGAAITAYTWNGSSPSFSSADSWTPSRTTPGTSDILVFDGAVTPTPAVTLDYTSPQTIGQLLFTNNVTATLSTDGSRTLTLDNNMSGDDFVIRAGSAVTVTNNTLAATSGLDILLTSTETAVISGTLVFMGNSGTANGRHTLQATSTEAVQFLSGSVFQVASTYATANPFGSSTTNAGSVIFRNGARFEQYGGGNPFALASPSSVVVFEPSSTFLFGVPSGQPSLGGRTYGTLLYDLNGTSTASAVNSQATIQGDFIVRNGTVSISGSGGVAVLGNTQIANAAAFTLATTGTSTLQGNVQVLNTATLSFAPATLQLSGTAAQALGGSSTATTPISFNAATTLVINNTAGVTLGLPITIPGTLQLSNGLLTTTTTNSLTLATNATGGSSTSFVNGPVIRPVGAIASGSPTVSYLFPVGKGTSYRPITLNVSAQAGTAYYRAEQLEGDPGQNVGSSGLTRVSIFRSFTITPFASAAGAATGTVTQPSNFTGTVTLSFGSNDGVTDPAAATFVVGKRASSSQPWANSGRSGNTASTLTSGAFTSFSDFVLASTDPNPNPNPLPVVLTNFTATRQASGAVQVRWATASEQRSAYFEVQRSLDGRTFATIATVAAQGTTTQAHTYASLDTAPPAGQLYYRLRQTDTDGTSTFSPVVSLAAMADAATPTLYPSPTHGQLTVAAAAGAEVQIIDLAGRVLQATRLPASGQLSVEALPAGTYLLRTAINGQFHTLRFTKD